MPPPPPRRPGRGPPPRSPPPHGAGSSSPPSPPVPPGPPQPPGPPSPVGSGAGSSNAPGPPPPPPGVGGGAIGIGISSSPPPSMGYTNNNNNNNNNYPEQSPPLMANAQSPMSSNAIKSVDSIPDDTDIDIESGPNTTTRNSERFSAAPAELLEVFGNNRRLPNGQLVLPPSEEITFYREQGHTLAWDFRINILNPLDDFVYYFPKEQAGKFSNEQGNNKSNKNNNRFEYEGMTLTTDETDTTIRLWKCHLHSHVLKPQTVQQYYKDCLDLYEQVKRAFVEPARKAKCRMNFCIAWSVTFALLAAGACALYWFDIWNMGFEEGLGNGGEIAIKITFISIIGLIAIFFIYLAIKQTISSKEIIRAQIEQAQEAYKHGLQGKIHGLLTSKHDNLTFSVVIKDDRKKQNKLWCILRVSNGPPMYGNNESVYETVKEDESIVLQKKVQEQMKSGAPPPPRVDDKQKAKRIAHEMDI